MPKETWQVTWPIMVKLPESKSLQHYLSSNKSEKGATKEAVVNKNWRVRLVLLLFSGDFYFSFLFPQVLLEIVSSDGTLLHWLSRLTRFRLFTFSHVHTDVALKQRVNLITVNIFQSPSKARHGLSIRSVSKGSSDCTGTSNELWAYQNILKSVIKWPLKGEYLSDKSKSHRCALQGRYNRLL